MIPSVLATQLQSTLLDYLQTTFNLSDQKLESRLFQFLQGPEGLLKGPFIDVRLPFRKAADGCGAIWLCPQLELSGEAVRLLAALVDDAVRGTPVRSAIGAQPVSARAMHAFVSLVWDRDVPGADDAAVTAHDRLLARLSDEGMLPYRAGPRTAAGLTLTDAGADVWRRLQAAFDPQGLLSTGKGPGSTGR